MLKECDDFFENQNPIAMPVFFEREGKHHQINPTPPPPQGRRLGDISSKYSDFK